MRTFGCTPCRSLKIVKTKLTFFVFDFVVVLEGSASSVEANLFKLFACEIDCGVKFGRRFVQGHQLVKRADFELALVNGKPVDFGCLRTLK